MYIFKSLQVYKNGGNGIKIAAVKYLVKLLETSLFSDALKEYLLNYYFLDCSCHLSQCEFYLFFTRLNCYQLFDAHEKCRRLFCSNDYILICSRRWDTNGDKIYYKFKMSAIFFKCWRLFKCSRFWKKSCRHFQKVADIFDDQNSF